MSLGDSWKLGQTNRNRSTSTYTPGKGRHERIKRGKIPPTFFINSGKDHSCIKLVHILMRADSETRT